MTIRVSLGSCPDFSVFKRILEGEEVTVGEDLLGALDKARFTLEVEASKRRIYGYCTGLGALMNVQGKCTPEWEHMVLVEHAKSVGPWAPPEITRLTLMIRLLQMSKGMDPVRSIVALRIVEALNSNITPMVPIRGSLGASGDLAPSAHIFLCITRGIGLALHRGSRVECSEALRMEGLKPIDLMPGEALALINNTAWSTAVLAYAVLRLEDIMAKSLNVARGSLELCKCVEEHYEDVISKIKSHGGISLALKALGKPRCGGSVRLQDPYSMRCTPFIYGALFDIIEFSKAIIVREACSTTTNPVVIDGRVVHSCAFYASHIAMIADLLAIGVAHLANVVERRIAQLMRSDITGLPEFLAVEGPVGSMIDHYVAVALTAKIRSMATPHSVHSTPVSGLQEDVIPQAAESALRLVEMVELLEDLVKLEEAVIKRASSLAMVS